MKRGIVTASLIEAMEERVMTAPTIERARYYHDRLDDLRRRYAAQTCPCCGRAYEAAEPTASPGDSDG